MWGQMTISSEFKLSTRFWWIPWCRNGKVLYQFEGKFQGPYEIIYATFEAVDIPWLWRVSTSVSSSRGVPHQVTYQKLMQVSFPRDQLMLEDEVCHSDLMLDQREEKTWYMIMPWDLVIVPTMMLAKGSLLFRTSQPRFKFGVELRVKKDLRPRPPWDWGLHKFFPETITSFLLMTTPDQINFLGSLSSLLNYIWVIRKHNYMT